MPNNLQIVASPGFTAWLHEANLSIAFTTYRMGKLFLLGHKPSGQLSVFERTFNRSMGIWIDSQTLWLASAFQLWRFENMLPAGTTEAGHDRLFVPLQSYTTGDINIHDVAVDSTGEPYFISTRFSCVGKLSERHSVESVWQPPFVSRLVPEDRCHLNGLCCDQGQPRYITACARTDTDHGWRAEKSRGGCVIDIQSNTVIVDGLTMPHSPRISESKLWLLNSGRGELGYVDRDAGRFEPIAFCPGFARGLSIVDNVAIVGLSRPRDKVFKGLELDAELARHRTSAICGLIVIDLTTGRRLHHVQVLGDVEELYDVAAMRGARCPKALGTKGDALQNNVWIQDGQRTSRFTAGDQHRADSKLATG